MIKLIIFDFDGVIINEYAKHYKFTKKRIKGLTEKEFKSLFDGNFREQFKKLKGRATDLHKFDYSNYKKTVSINQDIKKILQELSKKYILGIITSSSENGTEILLNKSGLKNIFSFDYGSETHSSKVEKFKKVLNEYKIKPKQCIFVTDTVGDILEAKKINIKSIAIDFGYHERSRLKKANPFKIVSSFSEIKQTIEKISPK
jgi:phosphoglycolate phosphatase